MKIYPFSTDFFTTLLKNLNKEKNLNFGRTRETHQFSEDIFHYNYTPQITRPIRITDRSATIIDNIFCEYTNSDASFREHNYFNI